MRFKSFSCWNQSVKWNFFKSTKCDSLCNCKKDRQSHWNSPTLTARPGFVVLELDPSSETRDGWLCLDKKKLEWFFDFFQPYFLSSSFHFSIHSRFASFSSWNTLFRRLEANSTPNSNSFRSYFHQYLCFRRPVFLGSSRCPLLTIKTPSALILGIAISTRVLLRQRHRLIGLFILLTIHLQTLFKQMKTKSILLTLKTNSLFLNTPNLLQLAQ